jgi:hypothetical protein
MTTFQVRDFRDRAPEPWRWVQATQTRGVRQAYQGVLAWTTPDIRRGVMSQGMRKTIAVRGLPLGCFAVSQFN